MGSCCTTETREQQYVVTNMQRKSLGSLPLHPKKTSDLEEKDEKYMPSTTRPLHDQEMKELIQMYTHALKSHSSSSHNLPLLQNPSPSMRGYNVSSRQDIKQVSFHLDHSKSAPNSPLTKKVEPSRMATMLSEDDASDIEDLYGPKGRDHPEDNHNHIEKLILADGTQLSRENTPGAEAHLGLLHNNNNTNNNNNSNNIHNEISDSHAVDSSSAAEKAGTDVLLIENAYDTPEGFQVQTGATDIATVLAVNDAAVSTASFAAQEQQDDDEELNDESEDTLPDEPKVTFEQYQQNLVQDLHAVDQDKRLSIHERSVQKNILRQRSMWKWSQDQLDEAEDDMRRELVMLQALGSDPKSPHNHSSTYLDQLLMQRQKELAKWEKEQADEAINHQIDEQETTTIRVPERATRGMTEIVREEEEDELDTSEDNQ